jgi:hypothetical protein
MCGVWGNKALNVYKGMVQSLWERLLLSGIAEG